MIAVVLSCSYEAANLPCFGPPMAAVRVHTSSPEHIRKKKKKDRKRGWAGGRGVGGLGGGRQISLSSLCMTAGKKKRELI